MSPEFGLLNFGIGFAYTLVAVIFCFLIYFRTRELYGLTKHKGIMYFRDAFLFLGLSYIIAFVFSLLFLSAVAFDFFIPMEMMAILFILPLGYFSTICIFYLVLSNLWKNFDNRKLLIIGHSFAILLSIISFITRSHFMIIYMQCALLAIAVILTLSMPKEKKKFSQAKALYLLVAALWLINLLIIDQKHMPFEASIFFELVSLGVFFAIYHKVSKWAK